MVFRLLYSVYQSSEVQGYVPAFGGDITLCTSLAWKAL